MNVIHMITPYWSYILAPFGLMGMWVAGKRKRNGWLLSMFTQALWLMYAVTTEQFGFIPGTLGYLGVYIRNYRNWGKPPKLLPEQALLVDRLKDVGVDISGNFADQSPKLELTSNQLYRLITLAELAFAA